MGRAIVWAARLWVTLSTSCSDKKEDEVESDNEQCTSKGLSTPAQRIQLLIYLPLSDYPGVSSGEYDLVKGTVGD